MGTSQVLYVGHLPCKKMNSAKCIVSSSWLSKTSIEVSVARDVNLREIEEKIAQAQKKLLNRVEHSKELNMSCWRTCADVSLLQFWKREREKHKTVLKEQSSLQSWLPVGRGYSVRESADTLTLF